MKAKLAMALVVAALVIAGVGFGGYALYQRHLTDGVKRLLLAAMDTHSIDAEIRQYAAQARPLENTRQDREVVGYLDDAIALATSVQEDEQKDHEEYIDVITNAGDNDNENDECFGNFRKTAHVSDRYHAMGMAAPKDVLSLMKDELQEAKDCVDRQKQESDARTVREKQNNAAAIADINKVRQAIGIPALPVK